MTESLRFRADYYDDARGRRALNTLVREVFGLDFEPWNAAAPQSAPYTPFSFFDGERVVANVSASPMSLVVDGRPVHALQIGTVATLPSYRGRGLVRQLMEAAQARWAGTCDVSFLFADEHALGLYPRFGYRPVGEVAYEVAAPRPLPSRRRGIRALDLGRAGDRDTLRRLADARAPVSNRLGVVDHTWLLFFHAAVRYSAVLTYLEDLDVVVIHERVGRTLRLVDVVGASVPPLVELYPYVGSEAVDSVAFAFMPDRMQVEGVRTVAARGSHLFVRGDFALAGAELRFPETSQA